jgi:hypothetical protein
VRRFAEPDPDVAASSLRATSTAPTGSDGSSAGEVPRSPSVRQPAPTRPCSGCPARNATTTGNSDPPAARSTPAMTSIFVFRDRVAVIAVDAATTSISNIGDIMRRRTDNFRGPVLAWWRQRREADPG